MDRIDIFWAVFAIIVAALAMALDFRQSAHPKEVPAIVCYMHGGSHANHNREAFVVLPGQDPRCYIGR